MATPELELSREAVAIQSKRDVTESSFRFPKALEILLGIIIVLEFIAPFVAKLHGFDAHLHLLWIQEYSQLNSSGILIPTWIPAGFSGFGSVAFYFYPPFTYIVGSVAHFLTGITDPYALYWIIGVTATCGSFVSARWLMRNLNCSPYMSTIGAAIFAFAPLRVFDLYNRAAISTHLAYVFLPLIAGAIVGIVRRDGTSAIRRILLLAVSASLLTLTSVPIMFAAVLAVLLVLAVNWRYIHRQMIVECAIAAPIVAGLVAFHFGSVLSSTPFLRLAGFRLIHSARDIFLWFAAGSGTYEIVLIYGTITALAVVAWKFFRKKISLVNEEQITLRSGLVVAAFVLFLDLSPLSAAVWNHVSILQYIQFPWRFYSFMLLFFAVAIAIARSVHMQRAARIALAIWTLGAILPMYLVLSNFLNHPITLEEDSLYAPNSRVIDVQTLFHSHKDDPAAIGKGVKFSYYPIDPYLDKFTFDMDQAGAVTFHRFYWPFWHVYVSDREVPSWPDSIGRATTNLPQGHSEVRWQLERTPLERAGFWISGVLWSGVIITSGIGLVRKRVKRTRALRNV